MDTIEMVKPSVFILENVRDFPKTKNFRELVSTLGKTYNIQWRMMDAKHHGMPQSRQRMYIVGKKQGKAMVDLKNIRPIGLRRNVWKFIAPYSKSQQRQCRLKLLQGYPKKKQIVFTQFLIKNGKFAPCNISTEICFCLTTKFINQVYIANQQRYMDPMEGYLIQGFRKKKFKALERHSLGEQAIAIGNSMAVNVLKRIIKAII